MNIVKEDFEKIAALLKHPALPGMGAVGREAAALLAKVEHAIAALIETEDAGTLADTTPPLDVDLAAHVEVATLLGAAVTITPVNPVEDEVKTDDFI